MHVLFARTDEGRTSEKRSVQPVRKEGWYGAWTLIEDASLLAGAYTSNDEQHLYCFISRDAGGTWTNEQKSSQLDKCVRDPELAYLNGKYYFMGRSSGRRGPYGRQFGLYQSDDGIHWGKGVLVNTNTLHPDGYMARVMDRQLGTPQVRQRDGEEAAARLWTAEEG